MKLTDNNIGELCVILLFALLRFASPSLVTVSSKAGTFVGFEKVGRFFDIPREVQYFFGIPYAEPPVGDLRFKKPVPKTVLHGNFDASEHRDACLQPDLGIQPEGNITYSEDCLYLDIYAPKGQGDEPLAVMVWIHGGGYAIGSSDIYIGDHLASFGNVIVVTINYRLTLWGFLCTGDDSSPGNYGMFDQHLAIKWVYDNIDAFGGDPNRITLFGESAGGSSSMFQALYPGNKGMVKRVILESGSAIAWWASTDTDHCVRYANKIAAVFDCSSSDSARMVECLRKVPADQLLSVIKDPYNGFLVVPMAYIPTRDNDFIKYEPTRVLEQMEDLDPTVKDVFASVDMVIGMNSDEGSLYGVVDPEKFTPDENELKNILIPRKLKQAMNADDSETLRELIMHEYTAWDSSDTDPEYVYREVFMNMGSDYTILDPMYRAIDLYQQVSDKKNKPYVYYFKETPTNHPCCHVSWFQGAGHCDEIPFVFGFRNSERILAKYKNHPEQFWEETTSRLFMTLWSNFAKTGNPNRPLDTSLFEWQPYTPENGHYLQVSRDMTLADVRTNLRAKYKNFWRNVFPNVIKSTGVKQEKDQACYRDGDCSP